MATTLLVATAATAIAPRPFPAGVASPASLYVRTRAAEAAGDTRAATAGFATLMAQEPANAMIATRAYRQAIAAGDMAFALRAAHALDVLHALPPDALALLALEQIRARNWVQARDIARRLGEDPVFGFLAPYFQAWIAFGSGTGDSLAQVERARSITLAGPYHDEQRAFLLIAMGRGPEAVAAIQTPMRLPTSIKGPDQGVALLLVHVAADFARQQYVPVGLIMARMAAYAAPDDAGGWLLLADLLRKMQRPDLAIVALDHIDAGDPLSGQAQAMRIGLLNDTGQAGAALAEAQAATKRPGAGAEEWGRVGDLLLVMTRPVEAASAYAAAVKAAEGAQASPDAMWPLLLQQGGALEQAGDWPGAKAALGRAYDIAPQQAIVLNQFGYSKIEHHEDVDRASAMIEQASKLRPDDPAITDSLGWVYYLRGKASDAAPLLERAAAGDPGEPTINEHLGDVYWTLGRQYEARFAWRAALVTAADKDRARLNAKIDTGPSGATAAP